MSPGGRGARPALRALGARSPSLVVITLLTAIPGAPLRNPVTDKIIGDSPFMDSLIVIITLIFFAAGLRLRPRRGHDQGHATRCSTRSRSRGPGSRACSSCSC